MQSKQLMQHHMSAFSKLSLAERLSWSFSQHRFLMQFMDAESKNMNKLIRRNGKKYFSITDPAVVEELKRKKK